MVLVKDLDVVFVDLCDVCECQWFGFILGSFYCLWGMVEFWVDLDSLYFKEVFGEFKCFIFYCVFGWCFVVIVVVLNDMGFEVVYLKNGFVDWVKNGGFVEILFD